MNLILFLKINKKEKTNFFILIKSFIFLLIGFLLSTNIHPIRSGPKQNYFDPAKDCNFKNANYKKINQSWIRYCVADNYVQSVNVDEEIDNLGEINKTYPIKKRSYPNKIYELWEYKIENNFLIKYTCPSSGSTSNCNGKSKRYILAVEKSQSIINPINDQNDFYFNENNKKISKKNVEDELRRYDFGLWMQNDSPRIYNNKGNTYQQQGNYRQAMIAYKKAISLDPNFVAAYNNYANTLASLGNYDEAFANFQKAINVDSNYIDAYWNRGNLYKDLGKSQKALDDYNRVIAINPRYLNGDVYDIRGVMKTELSDYQGALEDFSKALQLNPKHTQVFFNRGILKDVFLNDVQGALKDYSEGISIKKDEYDVKANLYNSRGMLFYRNRYVKKAELDFRSGLKINPKYSPLYVGLYDVYQHKGETKKACNYLKKAYKLNFEWKSLYRKKCP